MELNTELMFPVVDTNLISIKFLSIGIGLLQNKKHIIYLYHKRKISTHVFPKTFITYIF